MVSVTWGDIKLKRCFSSFEVGVFSNELKEYIFDAIECNFTIKFKKKKNASFSVGLFSTINNEKKQNKTKQPYPLPLS